MIYLIPIPNGQTCAGGGGQCTAMGKRCPMGEPCRVNNDCVSNNCMKNQCKPTDSPEKTTCPDIQPSTNTYKIKKGSLKNECNGYENICVFGRCSTQPPSPPPTSPPTPPPTSPPTLQAHHQAQHQAHHQAQHQAQYMQSWYNYQNLAMFAILTLLSKLVAKWS